MQITRRMDLWERDIHAGLVGDTEEEGAARDVRSASGREEEDETVARSCHNTVLSSKLSQAVCWAIEREEGGCLFPDEQCTNNGRPVAEDIREKHPDMTSPPWKIPCAHP